MRQALVAAALALASPAAAQGLVVGQTLRCDGPPTVVAVIGRVDTEGFGGAEVVSVSLFNLAPGARVPEAGHIPIEAETLLSSCPYPAAAHRLSEDFEEGYGLWREAVAADRGGYFTIPVSAILDIIAQNLPPQEDAQ